MTQICLQNKAKVNLNLWLHDSFPEKKINNKIFLFLFVFYTLFPGTNLLCINYRF